MKRLLELKKRYGWAAVFMAIGVALFTGQQHMPPGTDLVGALIALFGVGQQISNNVAERIFERIGAVAHETAELKKGQQDLVEIADDHATHLERYQPYLHTLGYAPSKVLRPTG